MAVCPRRGPGPGSGWQQESFLAASEDSQISSEAPNLAFYKGKKRMRISPIIAALALVVLSAFSVSAQTDC